MFGKRPVGWGNVPGVKELQQAINQKRSELNYYNSEVIRFQARLKEAAENANQRNEAINSLEAAIDKLVGVK